MTKRMQKVLLEHRWTTTDRSCSGFYGLEVVYLRAYNFMRSARMTHFYALGNDFLLGNSLCVFCCPS